MWVVWQTLVYLFAAAVILAGRTFSLAIPPFYRIRLASSAHARLRVGFWHKAAKSCPDMEPGWPQYTRSNWTHNTVPWLWPSVALDSRPLLQNNIECRLISQTCTIRYDAGSVFVLLKHPLTCRQAPSESHPCTEKNSHQILKNYIVSNLHHTCAPPLVRR